MLLYLDLILVKKNKEFEIINKKFNEIGFNEIEVSNFKSGNLNILIQNAWAGN